MRALVVALADMRLVEAKTSLPERYAPARGRGSAAGGCQVAPAAGSRRADGKVLAEAILGKRQHRLTGNQPAGTYLRRPGEAQSWLASGGVDLETEAALWLDERDRRPRPGAHRPHRDRGPTRARATWSRRDEPGGPLQLADLAEGEQAKHEADLSRLAGRARQLRLEEVKPRAELAWPAAEHTAIATSFDGVELTVHLAKIDDQPWAMLDARAVEALRAAGGDRERRRGRRGAMPTSRGRGGHDRARTRAPPQAAAERRGARRTAAALGVQDLHHGLRPADRAAQRLGRGFRDFLGARTARVRR